MKDVEICPVCRANAFEPLYSATFSGSWRDAVPLFLSERDRAVRGQILRCKECQFVFTSPQFDPDQYARIYEDLADNSEPINPSAAECARFNNLARRVRQFTPPGRFLDLGCGEGIFHQLTKSGDGCGFEISACSELVYDDERRVYTGSFTAFAKNTINRDAFDFVTAWDVVEHLAEPDAIMNNITSILKPGGWFFCSLPNISSLTARLFGETWNCLLLEHLWYFDPKTLSRYLRRFSFEQMEVSEIWYPADVGSIFKRLKQTYGWNSFHVPKIIENRVISLPIGLMFGAYRWNG